jgi:hypothetical protein
MPCQKFVLNHRENATFASSRVQHQQQLLLVLLQAVAAAADEIDGKDGTAFSFLTSGT